MLLESTVLRGFVAGSDDPRPGALKRATPSYRPGPGPLVCPYIGLLEVSSLTRGLCPIGNAFPSHA